MIVLWKWNSASSCACLPKERITYEKEKNRTENLFNLIEKNYFIFNYVMLKFFSKTFIFRNICLFVVENTLVWW